MRVRTVLVFLGVCLAAPAAFRCGRFLYGATGDLVISARTPQVDLYDGAGGKRVQTLDGSKFPHLRADHRPRAEHDAAGQCDR